MRDLTTDFQGKWHRVYFDNFFTSKIQLCQLEEMKIYGCGIVRSDCRLFPKDLKKPKLATRYIQRTMNNGVPSFILYFEVI